MHKKIITNYIFVIIIGFFLIVIISILIFINYQNQQANKEFIKERRQIVTPIPTITPTPFKIINPTLPPVNRGQTVYDTDALANMVDKVDNRQAISVSDQNAKNQALSLLPAGQKSGVLYQSNNIIIDYTFGKTDWFQVEILTTDIARAKEEGVAWFIDHGFSRNFICNYPLDFYLSFDVKQEFENNGISGAFSPLAPGCQ